MRPLVKRVGIHWRPGSGNAGCHDRIHAEGRHVCATRRTAGTPYYFPSDLQSRLTHRVQLATDGFKPYLAAVEANFRADIDYAMLIKMYKGDEPSRERYSRGEVIDARAIPIMGSPSLRHISTSYIEKRNLTIRCSFADLRS
jgi:hypothetical protein